jgi:hypothetical protein
MFFPAQFRVPMKVAPQGNDLLLVLVAFTFQRRFHALHLPVFERLSKDILANASPASRARFGFQLPATSKNGEAES